MYYKTLALVLVIVLVVSSNAMAVQLDEGFEGGVIPDNWTVIDNDQDGREWDTFHSNQYAHTGEWSARAPWSFEGDDDWLITPQLIVASGDSLIFWARRFGTPQFVEDFNVLLSTTTPEVLNFTEILGEVRDVPGVYTEYEYPLDEYVGYTVYLAIQCISVDGNYLLVDDVIGPEISGVCVEENVSSSLFKLNNYPNPFNYSTSIQYFLPGNMNVELVIYNIKGRRMRKLTSGKELAGTHTISWNGKDDFGVPVASGIYLYKLSTNKKEITKKMVILR